MGIDEIAAELYGLALEDFTAARNARAQTTRASGDRGLATVIRGLRKPSVGASLLNALVRRHGIEVEQVLALGVRLRAAQGTLGAAELRALDQQRRALTRAVAGQAVAIGREGGRSVSAQVAAAVEETLRSAMVDPDAGAALASGLLVDTFTASGLEPVDLSRVQALGGTDAVRRAPASSGMSVAGAEQDERVVEDARRTMEESEWTLRAARGTAVEARGRAVEAGRRLEDLQSQVQGSRRLLAELESQVTTATEAEQTARRAQLTATRDERSATDAAARAQRTLDRLLTPPER